MTDTQMLTVALASVPTMITVLIGILISNARLSDLKNHVDAQFAHVDHRFDGRVEEVLDARLKHLEERI